MILFTKVSLADSIDDETNATLSLLLESEVEFLDRGRYAEWLQLYTQDCIYWMPLAPDQSDALDHVSLFHEDRTAMELRIKRITHPRAHSLVPPVRTSHLCGTVMMEGVDTDTGDWVLSRRFQVTESQGDRVRTFAGLFSYFVRQTSEGPRIRMKRVDLVNSEAAFETIQLYI